MGGWARADGNGAGLGIPSAFALIGSPGSSSPYYQPVGMATASGKKEKPPSVITSCSAPETSQEPRTNAHREAPWAPIWEKALGFPPPLPGGEGRHTNPEGWGLALFAVGHG